MRAVVVGDDGTILHTDAAEGFCEWMVAVSPTAPDLRAVSVMHDRGWAVGDEGAVLVTSDGGTSWTSQASGTSADLTDVWAVDDSCAWAAGGDAIVLRTTDGGTTWQDVSPHVTSADFAGSQNGWLVDGGGSILSTSDGGRTWRPQMTGGVARLTAVSCADESWVCAVGDPYYTAVGTSWIDNAAHATLLQSSDGGATWTNSPDDAVPAAARSAHLRDVEMVGTTTGVAVGTGGTILVGSGNGTQPLAWTKADSATTADLYGIASHGIGWLWAVGEAGTIVRSTDGGASWTAITSPVAARLYDIASQGPAIRHKRPSRTWAVGEGGTILFSGDMGVTWSQETSPTGATLRSIELRGSAVIAVGGGGVGWRDNHAPPPIGAALRSVGLRGFAVIAVGDEGAFVRSLDNGTTWEAMQGGLGTTLRCVDATDEGLIAVGDGGRVRQFLDGAADWVDLRIGQAQRTCAAGVGGANDAVVIDGDGSMKLSAATSAVDAGGRWADLPWSVRDIDVAPDSTTGEPHAWCVGWMGAIYHRDPLTGRWEDMRGHLPADARDIDLNAVDFVDSDRGWIVGAPNAVLRTADGGLTWSRCETPDPLGLPRLGLRDISVAADPDGSVHGWVVGGLEGGSAFVLKTTGDGTEWTSQYVPAQGLLGVATPSLDGDGGAIGWIACKGGVLHTEDGGASWHIESLPTSNTVSGYSVSMRNAEEIVVAAAEIVPVSGVRARVYATTDGGATWTDKSGQGAGMLPNCLRLTAAALAADGDGWAVGRHWRAAQGGTQSAGGFIYHTTDGGLTWTPVDPGVGLCPTELAVTGAQAGPEVLVGAPGGTIASRDAQSGVWGQESFGFETPLVDAVCTFREPGEDAWRTWVPQPGADQTNPYSDDSRRFFSVDVGSIHFVVLDFYGSWREHPRSLEEIGLADWLWLGTRQGSVDQALDDPDNSQQAKWLIRDLNDHAVNERATVVLAHDDPCQWADGAAVNQLLCDMGVDLVCYGHSHGLSKHQYVADTRRVTHVNAGTGGRAGSASAPANTVNGYLVGRVRVVGGLPQLEARFEKVAQKVWAGDDSGRALASDVPSNNYLTFAAGVWNQIWAQGAALPSQSVNDIAFADAGHGWAVGPAGWVGRTSDGGNNWSSSQIPGVTFDIESVAFVDAHHGWAVGAGGLLSTTDSGATWSLLDTGNARLYDIVFADEMHGIAVGGIPASKKRPTRRVIYTTADGGTTWQSQQATGPMLRGAAFATGLEGWAVGDGGTILHTSDAGVTWQAQASGVGEDLLAVSGVVTDQGDVYVWACGRSATFLRSADAGATWTPLYVPMPPEFTAAGGAFHDLVFTDRNSGWMVGDGGVALRTYKSLPSWVTYPTGTTATLRCVAVDGGNAGWSVTGCDFERNALGATDWVALPTLTVRDDSP